MSKDTSDKKELVLNILKITALGTLVVGITLFAAVFPYPLLRIFLRKKYKKDYTKKQLYNSIDYIKRKKFISYKSNKVVLTQHGLKYLEEKTAKGIHIKKTAWDNKWRVVIFDIPEGQSSARHALRNSLKNLGFYHFQKSVFFIPYPCEKEIKDLSVTLGISEHVHLLVTERFMNDKNLLKIFKN